MHSIEAFCCRNPECSDFGVRAKGNLRWYGWSGHSKKIRGLHCETCGKYFSERKGSVLEHSRIPEEKAISVMDHLGDGVGVRQTSRLVHVHQNTVIRLARLSGEHAVSMHNERVDFSPSDTGSAV